MSNPFSPSPSVSQMNGPAENSAIERYYRFHSGIYDATRWSFLFGRDAIVEEIARVMPEPRRILEVGCGTGRNLVRLARRFTPATITGVDMSAAMLQISKTKSAAYGRRIQLVHGRYEKPMHEGKGFDVILFSYALSMFNPGWEEALEVASQDLSDRGIIAMVDFHDSRHSTFKKWMGVNHVRMDSHLRPKLFEICDPVVDTVRSAYQGVWQYTLLIGRKKTTAALGAR